MSKFREYDATGLVELDFFEQEKVLDSLNVPIPDREHVKFHYYLTHDAAELERISHDLVDIHVGLYSVLSVYEVSDRMHTEMTRRSTKSCSKFAIHDSELTGLFD